MRCRRRGGVETVSGRGLAGWSVRWLVVLACLSGAAQAGAAASDEPFAGLRTEYRVLGTDLKVGLLVHEWFESADGPRGSSQARLRRARLSLRGALSKDWDFAVSLDPSRLNRVGDGSDAKVLKDLHLSYRGLAGQELSLGLRRVPFMDEGTRSASDLDFAERAQVSRELSDRRELGAFYRLDGSPGWTTTVAVTNGSNRLQSFGAATTVTGRVDSRPRAGVVLGASLALGGGPRYADSWRWATHLRFDGGGRLRLGVRAEYAAAADSRPGSRDLRRDGYLIAVLGSVTPKLRLGLRYDMLDRDRDRLGQRLRTITLGARYRLFGDQLILRADLLQIDGTSGRHRDAILAVQLSL